MQVDNVALDGACSFQFSTTIAPGSTAAASAVEQPFALVGAPTLKAGDHVTVTGPGSGNNVAVAGARVDATGRLVIQFVNPTAGVLTHAAGAFQVVVRRA